VIGGSLFGAAYVVKDYVPAGLLAESPAQQNARTVAKNAPVSPPSAEPLLNRHLAELTRLSLSPADQGVLVETLDGEVLMAHNAARPINPASVLKLAGTLMALDRLGPDHRFRTAFVVNGMIADGVLEGALGIRSDGDPTLGREDVNALADELRRRGIRQVNGDLLVEGPFSFHTTDDSPAAAQRFKESLQRAGIRISGAARLVAPVDGTEVYAIESAPLLEIAQRLNSHSDNRIGDNLGTSVGGAAAIEAYLVDSLGIAPDEVLVGRPSGLGHNELSARAAMSVLRALNGVCARHGISLDQIIPLNGVDSGTMRARLVSNGMAGSIAAKTGTHYSQDGGVATLTGVAYTRDKGPVLFVVFNSHGPVNDYRHWQDDLLADVVESFGGSKPPERALAVVAASAPKRGTAVDRPNDPFATDPAD
jgi:D-alanyl-D-alanine carboxypeptidase/D-alanyl-D-alanine-endopeptidase (penicillin-binding protein 4)